MKLKYVTFRDRADLIDSHVSDNFVNSLEELKDYISSMASVKYFVNVRGLKNCKQKPFQNYKEAQLYSDSLVENGYDPADIFIAVLNETVATASDIDF